MKESEEYECAQALVVKFYKARGKRPLFSFWKDATVAKAHAIICVQEMIGALNFAGVYNGTEVQFYLAVLREIPKVGV